MESAAKKKLRQFIKEHIPVKELKEAGAMKDISARDYEKIAEWVCHMFGFKSIYEYGPVCNGVKCNGRCKEPSKYCKSYDPNGYYPHEWPPLVIDKVGMISSDKWLN